MEAFRTLAGPVEAEIRERGSRFQAHAVPITGRAAAEAFFAQQQRLHRDATHVVPAFRLHDGTAWASDAGEPAGSAGAPMLQTLGGSDLADVAAVVIRWYGGTNLGIGGLVRAYSGALGRALEDAPVRVATPAVRLVIRYGHEQTSPVLRTIAAYSGRDLDQTYDDAVTCTFTLPAESAERFREALRDATHGALEAADGGVTVIYT